MNEPNFNLTNKTTGEGFPIKVGSQPAAESVPVVLAADGPILSISAFPGVPKYLDSVNSTTPGITQLLLSDTVPVGVTRYLGAVVVDCRTEGAFVVKLDGAVVGSGKTGASVPSGRFVWTPPRPVAAGVLFELEYTPRAGAPVNTVRAYFQGSDKL